MLLSTMVEIAPSITQTNTWEKTTHTLLTADAPIVLSSIFIRTPGERTGQFTPVRTPDREFRYQSRHGSEAYGNRIALRYDLYGATGGQLYGGYYPFIDVFIHRGQGRWLYGSLTYRAQMPHGWNDAFKSSVALEPGDRVGAVMQWPQIMLSGDSNRVIALTSEQRQQFESFVGNTIIRLQGVYA